MSNSSSSSSNSAGGIGFVGALTILFVALKLTHVITWPWLWVLSPLWISFLLALAVLFICGLVFVGAAIIDHRSARKRRTAPKRTDRR